MFSWIHENIGMITATMAPDNFCLMIDRHNFKRIISGFHEMID